MKKKIKNPCCHSSGLNNHTIFLFSTLVNGLQIYRDEAPPGDGCSRFIDAYVKPV